jgi:hypothetical protein
MQSAESVAHTEVQLLLCLLSTDTRRKAHEF